MSSSELIKVIYDDRSPSVSLDVGSTGATVIKSNRGGAEPVYFSAKQSKRIIEYFGIPDVGNEAIDDILTFNDSYPIYVSAPSLNSKYAGVLVTKSGTKAFYGGKASKELDFAAIPNEEKVSQTPDGLITNFTVTLSDFAKYNNRSVGLTIDGTEIVCTVSDAEPEVITTTPDIGEGTYTRATGAFSFTFDSAPDLNSKILVTYTTNHSTDSYFAIFDKNPQVSDLKAKVTKTTDGSFNIDVQKLSYITNTYKSASGFPFIGSIVNNATNGYGVNIYLPVYLKNNDYITCVVNTGITYDTFTDDTTYVPFTGGSRGTTALAQLTLGWDYFKNKNKYKADIFFDTTSDAGIPALFNTLRNSYQKYSYYIIPMPAADVTTSISTATTLLTDNKGIAFYWGRGVILNSYTGGEIGSTLMGRVALRYADMNDVFNGLAPAWYNENGTHGGQLGGGILRMLYDATDEEQALLYDARVNPIIMHPNFGVVITRERTSQSLLSDYASIGHVRLSDYIVSNILNQAIPYQLYKLNDFSHRAIVKSNIEKIISPTATEPNNLLRQYIVKCDEENNNDEVLAREEFVISVAVKFTPFSKWITVYFINSDQGTDVSEVV